MTQNEKNLLLKELCARLPYKIKGERIWIDPVTESPKNGIYTFSLFDIEALTKGYSNCGKFGYLKIENYSFKPYLFPLSSIKEEQYYELQNCSSYDCLEHMELVKTLRECTDFTHWPLYEYRVIDWFNKNHVDYRGLIPMGLAMDATGLNIY